jgi:hypothetical protein
VLDVSATEFAQNFYWSLAHGQSLGKATREARIAVNYSIEGESLDWAIPVIFARDPESKLCAARDDVGATITAMRGGLTAPLRRASAREAQTRQVAVWDMAGRFPHLGGTLQRLNDAQDRFMFDAVSLSVPITALRVAPDRSVQFDIDIAARRLRPAARDLSADYLLCIVDKPILYTRGGEVNWNYYSWWPDDPADKDPLIVFSSDFKELPASGPQADRAIANAAAVGLIGAITGIGTRDNAPKDSVLYHNEERDIEGVIGHLRIDEKSRKLLMRKTKGATARMAPQDLAAVTKILDAFW